jgi:hypothetical protein
MAQGLEKQKPGHQAVALEDFSNPNFSNTKIQESTKCAKFTQSIYILHCTWLKFTLLTSWLAMVA